MDRHSLVGMYQHVLQNPKWWVGNWEMDMEKRAWRGIAYFLADASRTLDNPLHSKETKAIATLCKIYIRENQNES